MGWGGGGEGRGGGEIERGGGEKGMRGEGGRQKQNRAVSQLVLEVLRPVFAAASGYLRTK